MVIVKETDYTSMVDKYTLTIPHRDMVAPKFNGMDRLLIDDCSTSSKVSDILLGLETIARRIEEGNDSPS